VGERAAPAAELRKLHALLVIDSHSGLGKSVVIDRHRIETLLKDGIPRARLELTIFNDKDVTKDRILQYYRSIKVNSSDSLLFYYAGHGAIDPSKGHFLALQKLKTQPLLRSELRKAMQEKNPGLIVLLTDCCSERYKLPPVPTDDEGSTGVRDEVKELMNPVLRCLFFRHRGVVDINAAGDNTSAFGDDLGGGVFTRSLSTLLNSKVENLVASRDKFVSWQAFFPRLQRDTEKAFTSLAKEWRARGEKIDQSTQKPRAFALTAARISTLEEQSAGIDSKELDRRIYKVLSDIISAGTERYNRPNNDHNGCFRLYQGSLMTLRPLLKHRPALQNVIDDAFAAAEREASVSEQAYILRAAIDRIHRETGRSAAAEPTGSSGAGMGHHAVRLAPASARR
jgi:hypothetical protein